MKHRFWQHKFVPYSVENIISDYSGLKTEKLKEGIGTRETIVLERCECGAYRSKRVAGHWTLEQVRGS